MKRLMAVTLVALLMVPVLAGPADAWVRGGAWQGGWHGGQGGWHGGQGGWRGGCCWWGGPFALGLGVGALATAPLWAPAYAYPAYSYPAPAYGYPAYAPPAPVYQAPPPAYWYYCQNPQGYYPNVPQCPGGWMTVVPPGTSP